MFSWKCRCALYIHNRLNSHNSLWTGVMLILVSFFIDHWSAVACPDSFVHEKGNWNEKVGNNFSSRDLIGLVNFQGNSVSTTKYDVFTFLPKGLFEQVSYCWSTFWITLWNILYSLIFVFLNNYLYGICIQTDLMRGVVAGISKIYDGYLNSGVFSWEKIGTRVL